MVWGAQPNNGGACWEKAVPDCPHLRELSFNRQERDVGGATRAERITGKEGGAYRNALEQSKFYEPASSGSHFRLEQERTWSWKATSRGLASMEKRPV